MQESALFSGKKITQLAQILRIGRNKSASDSIIFINTIFLGPNNFPQHRWLHSSIRMVTENASLTLADITTILAPALRYEYERNNAPAQEEEGGRVKNRRSKRDMIGMSGWVRGPLGVCNLPRHPNQAGPDHIDSLAVITSPHLSAGKLVWSVLY